MLENRAYRIGLRVPAAVVGGARERRIWLVLAAGVGSLLTLCGVASAGYVAVDLYPLRGPSGFPQASPSQAVATSVVGGAWDQSASFEHATLWGWDGTPSDLTPNGFVLADAAATDGRFQVGAGIRTVSAGASAGHALLWSGTPASVIDLHPTGFASSVALGIGGGQQVGLGTPDSSLYPHALLWNGTAASVVDLNSEGLTHSQANGTNGSQQVGYGLGPFTQNGGHALLWTGTADSVVDLHPRNLSEISSSTANATNGRQQVGVGNEGSGHDRALLWSGTADSAVDLNPSGFDESRALGLNDMNQVGWAFRAGGSGSHAMLWSGTADSATDLHTLLPSQYGASIAYTIDTAGDVFGTAFSSADNRQHAIEWLPHAVTPGDLDLNGTVDFSDLLTLAQHYGQAGGWVNGDFNDDGTVNFADLLALAQNYGQSAPAALASVPEPASAAIVVLVGLIRRGRRRAGDPRACQNEK